MVWARFHRSIEEFRGLQFPCHQPAHHFTNLGMVLVLQFIEDVGGLGVGFIIKEGRSPLNRYLVPEQFGHLVLVRVFVESCARQVQVTLGADGLLADGQPLATYHAEARGDKVEQPVPETNRFHRHLCPLCRYRPHPGIGG